MLNIARAWNRSEVPMRVAHKAAFPANAAARDQPAAAQFAALAAGQAGLAAGQAVAVAMLRSTICWNVFDA